MGGEQAASVLSQVRGGKYSDEEREQFKEKVRAQYEHQGSPYYSSARLWDDGIIQPADTRMVLGLAIGASLGAEIAETKFGVFRM